MVLRVMKKLQNLTIEKMLQEIIFSKENLKRLSLNLIIKKTEKSVIKKSYSVGNFYNSNCRVLRFFKLKD